MSAPSFGLPVPFPVDGLNGDLLKSSIDTKRDGTVWLIAGRLSQDARERNLTDDMNGDNDVFQLGERPR